MQKPKPPPQSSSSDEEEEVARNDNDAAADKWEQLLRNMLPAGAPLPDEDQLDYSIAVEYQGPPPQFSKIHSSNLSSFPKTSKFSSSFKNHRNPSSFCHRGDLISKACRNCSIDATGNSDLEIETSFSASSSTFSHLREISVDEVEFEGDDTESRVVKTKSKVCNRCKKGISLVFVRKRGMRCLVCDALYCLNCVLRAMGSMPEGRKCVGCIGKPIDEAKRDRLGKYSRLLARVCSPLEVRQIMKAEKECLANQIRPEQVVVNGRPLRAAELADILKCSIPHQNLRPGRYWYDKDSGLWGKEAEKPERIISAKLNVGAKLPVYASDGNTQVYINGREITKVELKVLRVMSTENIFLWIPAVMAELSATSQALFI